MKKTKKKQKLSVYMLKADSALHDEKMVTKLFGNTDDDVITKSERIMTWEKKHRRVRNMKLFKFPEMKIIREWKFELSLND